MPLLRKAILVNSAEFVCLAIGLAQTIILTRVLGPAGIGRYSLINSTLMLTAQFCCLGFPISFLYHSQHDPDNTKEYLTNAIWMSLFLGISGGLVLVALIYSKIGYFGHVPWFTLLGVGLYVPIVLQSGIARQNLLIKIEAKKLSFMSIFVTTGAFLLVLILWSLGLLGVGQAILCFVSMAVFRAGIGWYWMRKDVDFSIKPTWHTSRKLSLMGIGLSWADVMVLLNSTLNIMIIKFFIEDFKSVGYFSRGLQIAMLIVTTSQAIFPLLFSRFASLKDGELVGNLEKAMRFISTACVIMILGVLVTAKWLVILMYGREFLPAVKPMMILLPGTGIYLISRVLLMFLSSRGKPEWSVLALFLGAMVNATLCWILIPLLGIEGAALSFTISNVGLLVTMVVIVISKYKVNPTRCLLMSRNDCKDIMKQLTYRSPCNV